MKEEENIIQNKDGMELYDLFDGLSDKYDNKKFEVNSNNEYDCSAKEKSRDVKESPVKESSKEQVDETLKDKQENKDIFESMSVKELITMSKTQKKNFYKKILNQDSKRLFQEINNITSELEENAAYPYNIFIPQDSLDIQVEIKRLTNKMWRQLKNLPKSERSTLVPTVKNSLLKLDSLINKGRFSKSVRKNSYIEAQSILFDLKSSVELMRNMKYISHNRYINYDMSITKIGKQLVQLIKSTTKSNSSNKTVDVSIEERVDNVKDANIDVVKNAT